MTTHWLNTTECMYTTCSTVCCRQQIYNTCKIQNDTVAKGAFQYLGFMSKQNWFTWLYSAYTQCQNKGLLQVKVSLCECISGKQFFLLLKKTANLIKCDY